MKLRLYSVRDVPYHELNRSWNWLLNIEFDDWTIKVELLLDLIKLRGEKLLHPKNVGGLYFAFHLLPDEWQIQEFHEYYDGPNCFWHFGPFMIGRSGIGDCDVC